MGKIALLVVIIITLVLIAGCSNYQYDGWKTIHIDGCGGLKIPETWVYYESNGLIYITDGNQNPILIQTHSYAGIDDNDPGITESNDYFDRVTCLKILSSAVISNGAVYGEQLVQQGDTQSRHYFLSMGYERKIDLIVWDEQIDEATVKQIANSFVREPYNLEQDKT